MSLYAVIDTNVLVGALLSKHDDSAVAQVINLVADRVIVPLYSKDIINEYKEVLFRAKLAIDPSKANYIVDLIINRGISVEPTSSNLTLIDPDDLVFYEVALTKKEECVYLITGNKKHFPNEPMVVSASEFLTHNNL
jgi:putative PIN family toxin of toxin-antitoxin system